MSDFAYPLHEECGVFGIYDRAGTEDVAAAAYSALYALQHRGQESCGIAVNDDGVINGHRDLGLVNEVFTPAVLGSLANPNAHMATGHVRYATAGSRMRANAQPMIVRHGRGTMALCHNGNLTNAIELRRQLENEGCHLPRLLRHRGHLLPHHPQPPAHGQHRDRHQQDDGCAGGCLQSGDHVGHQAHCGA